MLNTQRKLIPVQRKPRNPKTITKKIRKSQAKRSLGVENKGWASSDIDQSYT